ncbi:hypothetical protein JHK85_032324 [Glycine max]|nr:hypothetical protein JHK85_032324 [Glycine max]
MATSLCTRLIMGLKSHTLQLDSNVYALILGEHYNAGSSNVRLREGPQLLMLCGLHTDFRWGTCFVVFHTPGKWLKSADFFRADNPEGVEARNEVAALAFEDMISWMQEGGQVGIFDATNSSKERRNMLMKLAEGRCKIIFLETICNDRNIIERNIRLKIQQSPDYAEEPDFETGLQDFKNRLENYEKASLQRVYETVNEGSYIKMIDMVSGHGGQIQVNNISGYLPGRIVFFLVNTHLTPRPILLTRHGESQDNVRGRRIGGDTAIRSCKKDKLRYRYPRGESYLDVIQRLEPVIIELKRQRAPVVVISHQAVLRALYAYFADRPLNEIPHIAVPLHTIIEIQMGVTGVQEKRYKLMD